MLNVIEILSKKCKEEAVPEEVKKFLKRRIRYTYNYYTRAKFEHLENIFRKVGLWKGQRRELIE
jgi:endonuclease III